MSDQDCSGLYRAIQLIGRQPQWRDAIIDVLRAFEIAHDPGERNWRDEITGPIVDAMHARDDVVSRVLDNGLVFECFYRSKIARDLLLSSDRRPDHVFEPQTTKLNVHLAGLSKDVLVGGAYAGDQVIPIAGALKKRGGVCHAFDADPDQLKMLDRNAATNHLSNVVLNNLALWSEDDVHLKLIGDDALAHVEITGERGDGVRGITIDTYGCNAGVPSFGLIQLDMEGSELAALKGATRYLGQPAVTAPNIVFEIHRDFVDWTDGLANTEIIRLLAGFGYAVYAVRDYQSNVPMRDSPIELVPLEGVVLEGPKHGFNMLAVKDTSLLADPLFRFCRDVSPKLLQHKDPAIHHPLHCRSEAERRS